MTRKCGEASAQIGWAVRGGFVDALQVEAVVRVGDYILRATQRRRPVVKPDGKVAVMPLPMPSGVEHPA